MFKIRLPKKIENQMEAFRFGMDSLPADYIWYHYVVAFMDAARTEAFSVLEFLGLQDEGWMDGMKVLTLKVRDSNTDEEMLIRWSDEGGQGAWFRKGAGWTRQYEISERTKEDLVEFLNTFS